MKKRSRILYVAEYLGEKDITGEIARDADGVLLIDSNASELMDRANSAPSPHNNGRMKHKRDFVIVPYDRRKGW